MDEKWKFAFYQVYLVSGFFGWGDVVFEECGKGEGIERGRRSGEKGEEMRGSWRE